MKCFGPLVALKAVWSQVLSHILMRSHKLFLAHGTLGLDSLTLPDSFWGTLIGALVQLCLFNKLFVQQASVPYD